MPNNNLDPIHQKEFKDHKLFTKLREIEKFYDRLAFSTFTFKTMGTHSYWNIDSMMYDSIKGTLESIRNTAKNGRFNDSYTLLRKYHDSITTNIYATQYLKDNFSIENFVVQQIENWLSGKDSLPEYRIMSSYIRRSQNLTEINKLLFENDNRYKQIRDHCNNHTHYNFFKYVLLNNNTIHLVNRIKELDILLNDLEQLFVMHISYIFYLNDAYMMSSDYVDYMDVGMTPEEGCQYNVAPFIQEIFDGFVLEIRPDIASLIKSSTSMRFE